MSIANSTTKSCTRCLAVKPLEAFSPNPRGLFGRQSHCKECFAQRRRERRAADPDAARARERTYKAAERERDREYHREYQRQYRTRNREATRQRNREWYAKNKDQVYATTLEWRARNADKLQEYLRRYRQENSEAARRRSREWYARNPEKVYEKSAAERAVRARATPPWVDRKALLAVYTIAKALRRAGRDVHVDHIVPINGRHVCGLHVPWNLQIIPASENVRKGNKLPESIDTLATYR